MRQIFFRVLSKMSINRKENVGFSSISRMLNTLTIFGFDAIIELVFEKI